MGHLWPAKASAPPLAAAVSQAEKTPVSPCTPSHTCTLSESASAVWPFQYLRFDLVVSEAEVLEVGGRIGLD